MAEVGGAWGKRGQYPLPPLDFEIVEKRTDPDTDNLLVNLESNLWRPQFSQKTNVEKILCTEKLTQRSFIGRIEDTIICFQDCLTFSGAPKFLDLPTPLTTFF